MATFQISRWSPVNETAYDLYIERTNFDGFHLGSFAYGVQTVVAFQTIRALFRLRRSRPMFFLSSLTYVVLIFFFGTLGNAANIKLAELAFVENRVYPGGPNAYLLEQSSLVEINLAGYVTYILATWMQDGFLLYRFLVVFNRNVLLAIVPSMVYLLSVVSSILLLVELFGSAQLNSSSSVNFAIVYWSSSITTTLLLTFLIVGKLLHIRYSVLKALGKDSIRSSPYLSISAMLVESAVLYSLFALAFLILFVKNDPFQNVIFPALGQVQIIAPQLIILRVAEGRSFTSATIRTASFGARRTIDARVEMSRLSTIVYGVNPHQPETISTDARLEKTSPVFDDAEDNDSTA